MTSRRRVWFLEYWRRGLLWALLGVVIAAPAAAEERLAACDDWTLAKDVRQKEVALILRHPPDHKADAGRMEADVWEIVGRHLSLRCVDLDGDGAAEAILEFFSGGAHCCWDYYVFFDGPRGITEISIDMRQAQIEHWQDLDGDGKKEAVTLDDRWDYFGDLGHGGSPFPPMVLCLQRQEFIDCTERLPALLAKAAREFEDKLKRFISAKESDVGAALGLLVVWTRLGREADGWRRIERYCPACAAMLRNQEPEIRRRLSQGPSSR